MTHTKETTATSRVEPIRAMVFSFYSLMFRDIAIELTKKGVNIEYWVGGKRHFDAFQKDTAHFPDTIFHHYLDALAGIAPSGVRTDSFDPIGQEVIAAFAPYEMQVISMMTKLDNASLTLRQKRHLYHRYLWYWHGLLEEKRPDVLIFPDIPHTAYNFVVYHMARYLGIKTVICKRITGFPDRILLFEDFYALTEIRQAYEALKVAPEMDKCIDADVLAYYDEFDKMKPGTVSKKYKKFIGESGKEKSVEVLPRFGNILRSIREFRFLKTVRGYIRMLVQEVDVLSLTRKKERGWKVKFEHVSQRRQRRMFQKEYERLQSRDIDMTADFVYVPLHRQPEGSTNPMGGIFDDQMLMIDLLVGSLPKHWKLYVKEHPTQWTFPLAHLGRYSGYYEKLKQHPQVELVPTHVSGIDLVDRCKAVATVTGTTGMEAVKRQKPAIVFGYPLYMHCDGILRVSDVDSCARAMDRIVSGYTPDKRRVLQFLQAIKNTSVGGYVHKRHGVHSTYTYEESVRHIADGLFAASLST